MHIYIIRHGQSTNNAGELRVVDPPLSPVGEKQARYMARAMGNKGLTAIYASPMRRALATAYRLGEAAGLQIQVVPDVCEAGGLEDSPGLTRGEIARLYPACRIADSITDSGWWQGVEEELEQVSARASAVAQMLIDRHAEEPEARIAVVTHGTFGSFLIGAIMGVTTDGDAQFAARNTAITLIEREFGRTTLRFLNRVDHLPRIPSHVNHRPNHDLSDYMINMIWWK